MVYLLKVDLKIHIIEQNKLYPFFCSVKQLVFENVS